VRLTQEEQQIVREAEEAGSRAMRSLEHGTDAVIVAQQLAETGELFLEAASHILVRGKHEAKAIKAGKVTP
jgi:hypothetical protein